MKLNLSQSSHLNPNFELANEADHHFDPVCLAVGFGITIYEIWTKQNYKPKCTLQT
jgi:hypothetical protein